MISLAYPHEFVESLAMCLRAVLVWYAAAVRVLGVRHDLTKPRALQAAALLAWETGIKTVGRLVFCGQCAYQLVPVRGNVDVVRLIFMIFMIFVAANTCEWTFVRRATGLRKHSIPTLLSFARCTFPAALSGVLGREV
jgi:hypothetical protein